MHIPTFYFRWKKFPFLIFQFLDSLSFKFSCVLECFPKVNFSLISHVFSRKMFPYFLKCYPLSFPSKISPNFPWENFLSLFVQFLKNFLFSLTFDETLFSSLFVQFLKIYLNLVVFRKFSKVYSNIFHDFPWRAFPSLFT